MKEIYKSKNLEIYFEENNNLFIQKWTNSPSKEDFKLEMLAYTNLYKIYKPIYTLWLQELFTLKINDDLRNWIEKNVNEPCVSYGNKKCAFVVSKDVLVHVSVIDSFDKVKSCIIPKHFSSEKEARQWLRNENTPNKEKEKTILYDGVDENGNIILKIPTNDIKNVFKNIQNLSDQELYIQKNKHKLDTLTKREKEIFELIANGYSSKEIANKLFIQTSTVNSHRKSIIQKLKITRPVEWFLIAKEFNLLN